MTTAGLPAALQAENLPAALQAMGPPAALQAAVLWAAGILLRVLLL